MRTAHLPTVPATRYYYQGRGPQGNKFEHVSHFGHQMLVAEEGPVGFYIVRFKATWVIVTWEPPPNTHDWKHYVPATSLAAGQNG